MKRNEWDEMSVRNGRMKLVAAENGRNLEKNLPRLRLVHHEIHMERPRRELRTPVVGGKRLTPCTRDPPICVHNKQWSWSWSSSSSSSSECSAQGQVQSTPVVHWLSYSPLDPRFAGSIPAGVDGFFQSVKILSMTSFEREGKPWVPCRRFTARKRTSSRN